MARSSCAIFLQLLCLVASLLITTVSAVNVTRCGKDTACFAGLCGKMEERSKLRPLTIDEDNIDQIKCDVILQVKSLGNGTHVVWLRIVDKCAKDRFEVIIGGHEITKFDRYEINDNVHNFQRVDNITNTTDFWIVDYHNCENDVVHSFMNDEKAIEAIKTTETCNIHDFTLIEKLKNFDVSPVGFTTIDSINCPPEFTLSATSENDLLVELPEIFCVNNRWETDFTNMTANLRYFLQKQKFNGFPEYDNEEDGSYTFDKRTTIGCLRRECAQCSTPPPPVANCDACVSPEVVRSSSIFACAQLVCPTDYFYSRDGVTAFPVMPSCFRVPFDTEIAWGMNMFPFSQLTCIPKPTSGESAKIDDLKWGDANDTIPEDVQKHPIRNPDKKRVEDPKTANSDNDASWNNWLRDNWISSILAPIIIIAVVCGCIVFLVLVLRQKDNQEGVIRNMNRREEEEWSAKPLSNPRSDTANSNSEVSLI